MDTIQIKSTDEASQGAFVIINKEDFDADKHELFGAESDGEAVTMTAKQMKEALTARGVEFKPNASKADLQALLDAAQ